MKRGHKCLTWKTQMGKKKPRQSTNCRIHYMWEEYNSGSTRATISCASPFATCGGYKWRQLPLCLSLSLSLSISARARYTTTLQMYQQLTLHIHAENVCPKSYLYIYDFWVIYTNVNTNRSDRSVPVLGSAGSLCLPSRGTCFLTRFTYVKVFAFFIMFMLLPTLSVIWIDIYTFTKLTIS